jgi:hypothetical protein
LINVFSTLASIIVEEPFAQLITFNKKNLIPSLQKNFLKNSLGLPTKFWMVKFITWDSAGLADADQGWPSHFMVPIFRKPKFDYI